MILAFYCIWLFSGVSGKVQGQVLDIDTGEPVPYANVVILNTDLGTATDEDGTFFILNVSSNIYTVEISCVGYQTQQITDVIVETNQTARLKVLLKQAPVEMEPITVVSETPYVQKDWTSATYIIRESDIETLPIDYTTSLIAFQPSVANLDTALHVRGGRATEVLYLIDNVSIIDPQTGDPAINISKGVIDEIIFLPGGFDVEYGRAMSGVINLITERPANQFQTKVYGKTERIMPFYYDFGYENFQSSVHLPVSKHFKGIISLDVMHADDWVPKLYIQPYRPRDDYSTYTKWAISPSGKLKISCSSVLSRSQFGRTNLVFKFIPENYRSDLQKSNMQAINIHYMPDTRKLFRLTLSRLHSRRVFGVREPGTYGVFDDYEFINYNSYTYPHGTYKNPYGVYYYKWRTEGHYPEFQDKTSEVWKANLVTNIQAHRYHELKLGCEYAYHDLENFTYFLSNDTITPFTDEWQYFPVEFSGFIQDEIDYKGLFAKIGFRYDYFSSGIEGYDPKIAISLRAGFSFLVTDRFLFRANVGQYVQPPLYEHMYQYYHLLPMPSYLWYLFGGMTLDGIIGNPDLEPEKTMAYEIGLQGAISKNINTTLNAFYKDVTDLTGTRWIPIQSQDYMMYFNTEYANIKGVEAIIDYNTSFFSGRISYTLSWTKGTSSYANEIYEEYYLVTRDTTSAPPVQEYYLDFDQRHRIFVQGQINLPVKTKLHIFAFLGNGFPYTPPGPEGKYQPQNVARYEFRRQIDCVISKSFNFGKTAFNVNVEVINLLDIRYQIAQHGTWIPLESIHKENFTDFISFSQPYYNPGADHNHDGVITPPEYYIAFRNLIAESDDWVECYSAPRRARIGISMRF